MEEEIGKAVYSLLNLFEKGWWLSIDFCLYPLPSLLSISDSIEDRAIPTELIGNCKGLAFLTVAKAGFLYCPKV